MNKFNSRVPRYNDDSDYTTNSPSYYDDLARKNQLIKYLAKRIWEYEKTLHDSLEEIENILNEYITVIDGKIEIIDNLIGEGFNDRIEILLREWVNDGTLTDIINEEIFNLKVNIEDLTVNLKNYKKYVVNNDWKPAIEKALDDSNHLYIPEGTYNVSETFLNSNVTIEGSGKDTVLIPLNDSLFTIEGFLEEEKKITSDMVFPNNEIYVNNVDNINPNDYLLIKSQRDCLDVDDSGEEWTLGNRTSSSHKLYFGEFLQVNQINSLKLVLMSKPIYYDYLSNKSNETSPNARDYSTVQKVNFKENVTIKKLAISKTVKRTLNFKLAYNCKVEEVYLFDNEYIDNEVNFIYFENTFNCEAYKCHHEFLTKNYPTHYYYTNIYKVRSSQNTGFKKCYTKNGGQPFDISYLNGSIPSTSFYVDDCIIDNANHTGITSHGGTFQGSFINNKIRTGSQGINVRTRNSIISNNLIIGGGGNTHNGNNYGIALYDGWAVDSVISGNTIVGYRYGITIVDSSNFSFGRIGSIIVNNTIKNFEYGFYLSRNTSNNYILNTGLIIKNNTFQNIGDPSLETRFISFDSYTHGVVITENIFTNFNYKDNVTGIHFDNNNNVITIKNNQLNNLNLGLRMGFITDSGKLGIDRAEYVIDENLYTNVSNEIDVSSIALLNGSKEKTYTNFYNMSSGGGIPNLSIYVQNDRLYFKNSEGTFERLSQ